MNQAHGKGRYFRLKRLRRIGILILVLGLLAGVPATGAQGFIEPGKNIEAVGLPPIPSSLAREIEPYNGIYGLPLAGWDPTRREVWLKGLSGVTWVSRVRSPGAAPE